MEFRIFVGGVFIYSYGGFDVYFIVVVVYLKTIGYGSCIRDRERMGEAGGEVDLGLSEVVRIVFI